MTAAFWRNLLHPTSRTHAHGRIDEGHTSYGVVFAYNGHDIGTVTVRADSTEDAIEKARQYLAASIYPRAVVTDGVRVWPPVASPEPAPKEGQQP